MPRPISTGAMATRAAATPMASAGDDEREMLAEDEALQVPARITGGAEQRQLAPPFQDVARDDRGEADDAEHQAEAAQRLKRREVRVLDAMIRLQPTRRLLRVEAERLEAVFEGARRRRDALGRRRGDRHQKHPIAGLVRKDLLERAIANQDLALQHRIGQRADDAEPDRPRSCRRRS